MGEVAYLSFDDVLALHDEVMKRTGAAAAPLRDAGLLQSAIMRPQVAAHYEQADLIRQAVLLAVGISQAQAFLDGNKRTAFACLDVFLRLNGSVFRGDSMELAHQLENVANHSSALDEASGEFEQWLRANI